MTCRTPSLLGALLCCQRLTAAPLDVGGHRQLFFDDQGLESRRGLQRTLHPARKYEGNPLLTKVAPWEGTGPYVYGTVLRDEAGGGFRMWYHSYVGGRPDYFTLYATSTDGLRWTRPELNVVSDPRLTGPNNVVLLGSGLPDFRQPHSPSVIFTPWDPDPARRYRMLYWDINAGSPQRFAGLCLAYSPDGIHWSNHGANPVFDVPSDVNDACWDPLAGRYLLHHKMWRVEGKVQSAEGVDFPVGDVSYWQGFDGPRQVGDRWRVWGGRVVDYSTDTPRYGMATVEYARQPQFRRVVARAESADAIRWGSCRILFELPQDGDDAGTSTYGMSGFPYEGMYVGLLRVMHDELTIDLQLTYSYDDMDWRRCHDRTPFIGLGAAGSCDDGMVFSSTVPVVVRDELCFYYGGFDNDHAHDANATVCLAKLRRDGFVSLDAAADGELVTRPLIFAGTRLALNLACEAGGQATVELQNEQGQPLPGYALGDCDPVTGDAVTQIVRWRGSAALGALAGKAVKVRIALRRASLYAFGFSG
jgi:hypothetical protein